MTIARSLTDSFAGIAPASVPLFVAGQGAGVLAALILFGWLLRRGTVPCSNTFPITIYPNPDCGTSRNTLAMIEAAGYRPEVVEYRTTGWTRPLLERLLADMEMTPGQILREKGTARRRAGADRAVGLSRDPPPGDACGPAAGEPADRGHAERHQAVPAVGGRA